MLFFQTLNVAMLLALATSQSARGVSRQPAVMVSQYRIQKFFGKAGFLTSVARRKTAWQLGGSGVGYLAFCGAQNIVFVAVCDDKQAICLFFIE